MTEERFWYLMAQAKTPWGLTQYDKDELYAAITFEPEPVKYFQKRVELPEPCREPLKVGQKYYVPHIKFLAKAHGIEYSWEGDSVDDAYLAANLIYLTPEHATARAAAWLEIEVGE
jgi:hypothetical protein